MSIQDTLPYGSPGLPIRTLKVEVLEGPDAGLTRTTPQESISIGTAETNDLVLTDDTVSRFHVDLVRSGPHILARDHGSTNGTVTAGVRLERAQLPPGTVLRLGKTSLRVTDGETVTVELFEGERLGPMLGRDPAMRHLMARVRRAAQSDSSVLILGETGTGKEVMARAIHESSARGDRPFETVDCGSMLPTLVASELFGHERGAFTGAENQHTGAFERANGGTLFLDEIGELPAALQIALLGVLERRTFRRVGGKDQIQVDVRVLAATHRDLRDEVNRGTFRQDLYYRLAVISLVLPPLRDRPDDIPLLVEQFVRDAGFSGPIDQVFPPAVMATLKQHRWPGNARELRNAVEAAMVMGEVPRLEDSRAADASGTAVAEAGSISLRGLLDLPYNDARARLVDKFEEEYISALLDRTEGNVSEAARVARMNRSYLTRLLKRRGVRIERRLENL